MERLILFFIIIFLGCKLDEDIISLDTDCKKINWKDIKSREKTKSGLFFLNEVSEEIKENNRFNIPIPILLGYALYKTNDGLNYIKKTNNPFNIKCYEIKCPVNHCFKISEHEKIRNFKSIGNATEFQSRVFLKSYNKNEKNILKILSKIKCSENYIPENDIDIYNICTFIKTYKILR